uniref:Uncharacterized protein n=1 Tax=Octopus bimaculoides TaxID=37653 RepID=A0A0L8GVF8_OCTBM
MSVCICILTPYFWKFSSVFAQNHSGKETAAHTLIPIPLIVFVYFHPFSNSASPFISDL